MAAVALACQELHLAVAINVDHLERVHLRERFVDGVLDPGTRGSVTLLGNYLLEPVDSVAVALAVDDVGFAVVEDVVSDDWETRVSEFPIRMPFPLICVGIDLTEPAVGGEDVCLAVAIDVSNARAVAVLPPQRRRPVVGDPGLAAADVMHFWLLAGEVDPQNAGVVVVGEDEVGLAVAVDVGHPAALSIVAVGDEMLFPFGAIGAGVFPPEDAVGHPASSDYVRISIVVDVDGPLAAVGDEFTADSGLTVLAALPLTALGAWILVPVGSAEQVGTAVPVHVERCDALGVISAEPMDEERSLGNAAGTGAGGGDAVRVARGCGRRGRGLCLQDGYGGQQRCGDKGGGAFRQSHGGISSRGPFSWLAGVVRKGHASHASGDFPAHSSRWKCRDEWGTASVLT